MEVVTINSFNIHLLENFISNIGEAALTFRYFDKRNVSVTKNHITTLVFINEKKAVAYGHLEKEDSEIWLGICVLPDEKGKGYGMLMMEALIQKAKQSGINKITLTVDKINGAAINLYEKLGFKIVKSMDKYFKYDLQL